MDNNENVRLVGKKKTWPYVLLGVIVLAAAIWAISSYVAKNSNTNVAAVNTTQKETGNENINTNSNSNSNSNQTLTDFHNAAGMSADAITGKTVAFQSVVVKSVGTDDMVFWLNDSGATDPAQTQGKDMLVYMNPTVQAQAHQTTAAIKDGQKVTVAGTILPLPSDDVMQTQWKLNVNDISYIKNKGVYLAADSVSVTQ